MTDELDRYLCIEDEEGQYTSFKIEHESDEAVGGVHISWHYGLEGEDGADHVFLSDEEMEELIIWYQKEKR